ncbi:MAG: hydrogenase small subunit [Nitrospinales bacterium]
MLIKRREFLKYCIGSAAALGLDMSIVAKLDKALAADNPGLPNVIWLSGASCTGCTVSLANLINGQEPTDVADLLINHIDLMFHPNLMGAAGDLAVQNLLTTIENPFILAVEGGIPTAFNGHACMLWTESGNEITAMEAVSNLANNSNLKAILCIGTCSSFGGIPGGYPNPTTIKSVGELTGKSTINIPGCPTHPDWIAWTVANLLAGNIPSLDLYGRPASLFQGESRNVHENCPREEDDHAYAHSFGVEGLCLKRLGCKGEETQGDCPRRKWNNSTNWCIGANSICLGCTEKGFPDSFSPFYNVNYSYSDFQDPDPDPGSAEIQISKALWTDKGRKLTVEGTGPIGAVVIIRNANSGNLLGSEEIQPDGIWEYVKRFKRKEMGTVPCSVKCEVQDDTEKIDILTVENSPSNCEQ